MSEPQHRGDFDNQQRSFNRHIERQAWLVVLAFAPILSIAFFVEAAFRIPSGKHAQDPVVMGAEHNGTNVRRSFVDALNSAFYKTFLLETSLIHGTHSRDLDRRLGIDKEYSRAWFFQLIDLDESNFAPPASRESTDDAVG